MKELVFEDQFSVGIQEFDDHHKTLFRLVNTLIRTKEEPNAEKILDVVLDQLYQYTVYHFTAEEDAMAKYDYPNLIVHQMEHLDLLIQVKEFRKRLDSGELVSVDGMLEFLSHWLLEHTLGSDQDYGPHLNAHGMS